MLGWMRSMIDPAAWNARLKAVAFVDSAGEDRADGAKLLAKEPGRWVFAVFCRPARPTRPAPYKVISVSKDLHRFEELIGAEAGQYALRDYK